MKTPTKKKVTMFSPKKESPISPKREETSSPLHLLESLKKPLVIDVRKRHRAVENEIKCNLVACSPEDEMGGSNPLAADSFQSTNSEKDEKGKEEKEEKEETTPLTNKKTFKHPNSKNNNVSSSRKRRLHLTNKVNINKKMKGSPNSPSKDYDADDLIDKVIY